MSSSFARRLVTLAASAVSLFGTASVASAQVAPGDAPAQNPAGGQRPNVLFIAVDDLKPLLGCYGNSEIKTPNIDRLAARGMVFANNHCQQAICGPSRASIFTGWRPDRTQVWDLKTKMRAKNPDLVTIPQHFAANGYATLSMGKMHDGRCCDGWGVDDPKSWNAGRVAVPDRYPGAVAGEYYAKPETVKLIRSGLKEGNYKPAVESADVPDDTYFDGSMATTAVETIQKLAKEEQRPFFLGLGFKRPHLPFAAPQKYWELYNRDDIQINPIQEKPIGAPNVAYQDSWELRMFYTNVTKQGPFPPAEQKELIHGYYAAVSYIDACVGKVLDELDRQKLTDKTIIVLWGDHGFHLGDHGMFAKITNYEQSTRSPMIISAPGLKPAAGSTQVPTEFIDMYPTLCDLAGIPIPSGLDGVTLKPLFEQPEKPVKAFAMSQYPRGGMGYSWRGMRYRYVKWFKKPNGNAGPNGELIATELYDYQSDPLESKNLVDDPAHADIVSKFEALIAVGPESFKGKDAGGL